MDEFKFKNQSGFKKTSVVGMLYSIQCTKCTYTEHGSMVSICSLDLSKAFDRINHYALLIKLMYRRLPNEILNILELWLRARCTDLTKWLTVWLTIWLSVCALQEALTVG